MLPRNKTGEIWAFQTRVSGEYRGRQFFHGDHIPEQWAELLAAGLNKLVESGAQGPYHVRLGVTGLEGLHWDVDRVFGGEPPIALEPSMEFEFAAASNHPSEWRQGFAAAWVALRRVFGMPSPGEEKVESAVQKAIC